MSNSEKKSHWKSLAALLGTEPPTEDDATQPIPPVSQTSLPPASAQTPRSPEPPRPAAPKAPPQRRESNWGKLASILGLSGSPEPAAPPQRVERSEPFREPVSPEPRDLPPVSHSSDAAVLAAAHWSSPERESDEAVDPLEMTSEPFIEETMDAIDLESIEDRPAPRESESSDRPRRRRRRGRGRGRGRRPEGEQASVRPTTGEFDDRPATGEFDDRPVTGEFDDRPTADSYDLSESSSESSDTDSYQEGTGDRETSEQGKSDSGEAGRENQRRRRRRGAAEKVAAWIGTVHHVNANTLKREPPRHHALQRIWMTRKTTICWRPWITKTDSMTKKKRLSP
jgi:hypothetical protein